MGGGFVINTKHGDKQCSSSSITGQIKPTTRRALQRALQGFTTWFKIKIKLGSDSMNHGAFQTRKGYI